MHAHDIWNQPRNVNVSGKQKLIVEVYEEYNHIITQKGNTVTINKNRDAAWQIIANRLNA